MNGKGDKYRVKWSTEYESNFNRIFNRGNNMKLVDYRNRALKVGERVRIEEDIPSVNGMLYKHTIVKLDEFNDVTKKIRVTDSTGKVWWIEPNQVSCSFL